MGKSRGLSQGQAMALAFDGSWLWPRFLQAKAGPGQAKPGRHITNSRQEGSRPVGASGGVFTIDPNSYLGVHTVLASRSVLVDEMDILPTCTSTSFHLLSWTQTI